MLNSSGELPSFLILERICLHIPTGIFKFVIPVCGSQITREMNKNKLLFHRIAECIVFKNDNRVNLKNLEVLETLYNVTPVEFSACAIVTFSGSIILCFTGNLFNVRLTGC